MRLKTALEKMYANAVAQGKVAKDLMGKVSTMLKRKRRPAPKPPAPKPPPPAPKPPPPAPPPAEPTPVPAPPAPPPVEPAPTPAGRSRERVTEILLEEFAKQTSFIPGGRSGSATPEEIADPKRAIQLWTDGLMKTGADTMDEAVLRSMMKGLIAKDVQKYKWHEKYPPKGKPSPAPSPTPPSPPPPPAGPNDLVITVTGSASMPKS